MSEFLRATHWDELIRSKPLAAALGLFSHYVLNNGEWDNSSHLVLSSWVLTFAGLVAFEYAADPRVTSILGALQVAGTAAAVYLGTLIASILVYRAFFHRLRKFPGPFGARLSKLYSISRVTPKCQYYTEIEGMHKEYKSDIVRTGPRELSVASADAIPLIHGPMTKCTKSVWYSGSYFLEGSSVHTSRSKQDHRERRKIWERAFNAKALREYEPRLNRHAYALIERLKEHANEPSVRISNWINYYSFDVMGDIGFSRSFGMVEKGQEDDQIKKLHQSMAPMSYLTHITWVEAIMLRTGFGAKDILDFMNWGSNVLRERKKITPAENDVFGWLLDPNDEDIPRHLNADARLLVIAGSDTTAATLTWLVYELCKDPALQARVRKVVDEIKPEKAFLYADDLADCPYLDGVVNEAMRLHPSVPGGVSRETPREGLTLPDQTYIPGETLIWMPIYTMQRDARYFRDPLKFMPERWTDEASDYIIDKRAFMPFSTGVYNCVGQKLAMMEMRSVTANLVRAFEISFVEGDDGSSVPRDTKDVFTTNVGSLDVRLTPRRRD